MEMYLILCLREDNGFHVELFQELEDAKSRFQWMIDGFFEELQMEEDEVRYMLDECEYEIYDKRDDAQMSWGYASFVKGDKYGKLLLVELTPDLNGRSWGCIN